MKQLRPEQKRWLGISLITGAVAIGLSIVISAVPLEVGTPKRAPQTSALAAQEDANPTEAVSHVTVEEMEDFLASIERAGPGHDPFLTSGEHEWKRFLGELKERPPRLKGIVQMEDARVALIQDSRFREGDEVQGFRITKIEDKRVLLTKGGKIYTLSVDKQ